MPNKGFFFSILLGFSASAGQVIGAEQSSRFELHDGDRIVFLGNSFFERAVNWGHIETSLSVRWPDRTLTFRNLGWDGDTVFGHSRAGGRRRAVFGDAKEGFRRLVEHVRSLQPTVIFLAYGFNESFQNTDGLEPFRAGLERLMKSIGTPSTRFVLLSPTPMAAGFGTDLTFAKKPDGTSYVTARNRVLAEYSQVIQEIAQGGNHHFVDLFAPMLAKNTPTENGIHLSNTGYREAAQILAESLELPPEKIDVQSEYGNRIRAGIIRKNTLFFHRWRPRNDAFVYGERKDEQKIAQTEPEKFEPFIEEQEQLIRKLLVSNDSLEP